MVLQGAHRHKKYQGFPRDISRRENPAGPHGIRDNPVLVQTDPVEVFVIPIPSRPFFEIPIPYREIG